MCEQTTGTVPRLIYTFAKLLPRDFASLFRESQLGLVFRLMKHNLRIPNSNHPCWLIYIFAKLMSGAFCY